MDGTLANNAHRVSWAKAGEWKQYEEHMDLDSLNEDVYELCIRWQNSGGYVMILTGRNEATRIVTFNWLLKHRLSPEALLMRPDKNFRPDLEIKKELLMEKFGCEHEVFKNVAAAIDDQEHMVAGFKEWGMQAWLRA